MAMDPMMEETPEAGAEPMAEGPDVSEDYIAKVADSIKSGLIPEDFEPAGVEVPVTAADGSEVAVVLTGIAQGGKLTSAMKATVNVNGASEEPMPEDGDEAQKPSELDSLFSEKEEK